MCEMSVWRLSSWDPKDWTEHSEEIASAEQVAARAAELLELYKETPNRFPGLSLEGSNAALGSMAIGVAPIGWALFHSSEDRLTQHCTRLAGADGKPLIPIEWEQETEIPRDFFIPEELALVGLRYWLDYGKLAPALPWSDHCY